MKNLIVFGCFALSMMIGSSSCSYFQKEQSTAVESSEDILLVKYHADWCGSCKALSPLLTELNTKLDGKKVKYVELDFTDESTSKDAKASATSMGLQAFLTEKQKTGYVAIIDAKSKEELGRLTKTQSVNEMYEQVLSNL